MPDVNWWAILVCGVVSMVLGSLWYGPVFGKLWIKLSGWDKIDEAVKQEKMKAMKVSYSMALLGALVMAFVLSHNIVFAGSYMRTEGVSAGLQTAFWTWLGFVAPVTMSDVLWGGKSWKFWALNSSYYLVQLLIFGLILGAWQA